MQKLSKRRIEIAEGKRGHSKEIIQKYLNEWKKEGFDISQFEEVKINIVKPPRSINNDKRIFLLESFNIYSGGVERWILDFIRYYPDKNIEWRIWTHESRAHSQEMLLKMEKLAKVYMGHDKLEEASKDADLCLACEHFKPDYFTGKTIAVCHGESDFYFNCMDKLSWCKHNIGVSKTTKHCFRGRDMTLIYNGIDFNRCFPNQFNIRKQLGIPENKFVIMTIARLSFDKRLHLAMEATNNIPNSVLVMLGIGAMEKKLIRYANELGIDYRMVGFKEDVGNYLNIADVYLVTSGQESFCLGGGEAAIAGVPLVATPVGMFTELDNFYTVSMEPEGREIAETIKKSVADTNNTEWLRNYYLNNFNVNNFVGQWKILIDSVLNE